jgi:hypothetical protein
MGDLTIPQLLIKFHFLVIAKKCSFFPLNFLKVVFQTLQDSFQVREG